MEYRIIELEDPSTPLGEGVEVDRFDSAYQGMEALRSAVLGRNQRAQRWYLVDGAGRVLLRPEDVGDLAA